MTAFQWTVGQVQDIVSSYEQGESATSIGGRYGTTHQSIHRVLVKQRIRLRSAKERQKKRACDTHYFQIIDTEEKAYWLGFITADGCITSGKQPGESPRLTLHLGIQDKEHLLKFKQALQASHMVSKTKQSCSLTIFSSEMVADLAMHGIVPRKTCSTKPAQILPELARHYWRGVLDGDGSISRNGQVKLTLVGDDEVVLGFQAFVLAHCPRVKALIFRKVNRSTFRITDAAAIRMLEVLYGEAHVYLDRNYERAQTVLHPFAPFGFRRADSGEAREGASCSEREEEASPRSPLARSGQLDRLLAAKLLVPCRRAGLVPRAHLTQRLQAEPGRKLTLLVAPAGFGKTTLLLDWITSGGQPVAWLSLDAGDNSPVRFWRYVVAALQSVRPGLGTATLATLHELGPSQLEPTVAELLNELAVLEQDLALVLEDYQLITEPAIHASLTFLLEHLPPRLQLVIASRVEPPLPLARLRASGQLLELRAEDLRFSAEEARRFLCDTMGLVLEAGQVAQLVARTEGWVAGLQLAALSLRGRAEVEQVVAGFDGTHRSLVDYLTQEVLGRQPEALQRFLLETSLLERLCAPLCAALTSSDEAPHLLERAEQANLFLMPLDEQREWYRYHALFAQFLQQQLHHTSPEQIHTLHRRAAQWFEEQELIAEAMHHALAGADDGRAARLLIQHGRAFLLLGEIELLRIWIQALPQDLVRAQPRLCLILADALTATGRLKAADGWLRAAQERLRAGELAGTEAQSGSRGLLEEVLARRAAMVARQLDLPPAQEPVRQAGGHLPPEDALGRSIVAYDLGMVSFRSGDMVAANQAYAEVSRAGAAAGSLYYELIGLNGVGAALTYRGQLRQAVETFRHVLQRLADQQGQPAWIAGTANISLGVVLREWNDLDEAEQSLLEGLEQVTPWGHLGRQVLACLHLARIRQARSDAAGAHELLAWAQEAARRYGEEFYVGWFAACQARLWLQQGHLAAAERWAAGVRLEPDQPLTWVGELEQLALVRVQLAQGQAQDALLALDRLLAAAEATGRGGSVLEIRLLEALAQQRLGNTAQALAHLAETLALSESEGYVRLFVDEGPVMEALLTRVLAAQRRHRLATLQSSVAYLEHLLAAFRSSAASRTPLSETAPSTAQTQPLIEPLNAHELAVLRLLASGKSTVEMAGELIVAPSTIHWHLKQLYAKLQVHSRTQALSRARQFHLLA